MAVDTVGERRRSTHPARWAPRLSTESKVIISQLPWEIRIQREYAPEGWRYVAD
jgi:hypothetical protein